jgi:hypothetical protein
MAKINIKYKKGGPSQMPALRAALKEPIDLKESLEAVITELNTFATVWPDDNRVLRTVQGWADGR